MFGDIFKAIGEVAGTIIGAASGTIVGVLGITEEMVDEAKRAGCSTYEEVK